MRSLGKHVKGFERRDPVLSHVFHVFLKSPWIAGHVDVSLLTPVSVGSDGFVDEGFSNASGFFADVLNFMFNNSSILLAIGFSTLRIDCNA